MQYSVFEQKLAQHVLLRPQTIALQSRSVVLTYAQLQKEIAKLRQEWVLQNRHAPIAIAVANHPAWVVLDLATLGDEIPLVPIPFFFSDTQILHAIIDAGADTLITDQPERISLLLGDLVIRKSTFTVAGKRLMQLDLQISHKALPTGTAKITYTSGTTGNPKGVCLSASAMLEVANSVVKATSIDGDAQHLCVLPLSTFLENVAGVYAALIAGATIHLLTSEEVGFIGSQLDVHRLHHALLTTKANTAIFIPELLKSLVLAIESGATSLPDLHFLAVGGAAVSSNILLRAKKLALPVYQGYGLSECASVVALNTYSNNQLGSVGKPLSHVEIMLAEDDEILVKGSIFLGYTGDSNAQVNQEWLQTGDIGAIDSHGFLHIKGRKKNIFISSFGRNVSPEWVETALLNSPQIVQACVFGEAKPWNLALIVTNSNMSSQEIDSAIDSINQQLPDYARISKWVAVSPFTSANQQLTLNGRLKRKEIYLAYQQTINNLYKEVA